MQPGPRAEWTARLALLGVLLVTALAYAPSLGYGFIWDDPTWFERVAERNWLELIQPIAGYQFYRPGIMLYHRLFMLADHTFAAHLMHAAQLGWHLLHIALLFTLGRRLGLGRAAAVAASALAAWHPWFFQAVAWAAPPHPMTLALLGLVWLTYLQARRQRRGRRLAAGASLLLFAAALTLQEAAVPLAAVPLVLEWTQAARRGCKPSWGLALAYPLLAAAYGVVWLLMPRASGYTGLILERDVGLYLLQGLIFPVVGRVGGFPGPTTNLVNTLPALGLLTLGALLLVARDARQGRQTLAGLTMTLLGIAPAAIGLHYDYVSLGSRLLYNSAPGLALLWASALVPAGDGSHLRRRWRAAGLALTALISLQSLRLLNDFRHLYQPGVALVAETIQAVEPEADHMLFVNYPDRYTAKRPPYPLGYWGITLAPICVDLGEFSSILTGRTFTSISASMPWVDTQARQEGPFQIDLRGAITPPDLLCELARPVDAVYLSRARPDGSFALERAGRIEAVGLDPAGTPCRLAALGPAICLQAARVERLPDRLRLRLTWLSRSPAGSHDTILVHLSQPGQPPAAQADGYAWRGMIPPAVWQPGDLIEDERDLPLADDLAPGSYALLVGVYDWVTGERRSATTPDGRPLPDNVYQAATLTLP